MGSFWSGVLQNLVADVLIGVSVAGLAVSYSYWKFSGVQQRLAVRIPARPDKRVLAAAAPPEPVRVHVNEPSPFRSPLAGSERAGLIAFYQQLNRSSPHDGRVVRLDGLTPGLSVSKVGFFDLLTTNFTAYPDNIPVRGVLRRLGATLRWLRSRAAMERVAQAAGHGGRPQDIAQALANDNMANVAAVSVLLVDEQERAAVARRASRVAVASGRYSATVAGTVAIRDLRQADPFRAAALRECTEEIGLGEAGITGLTLDGIVMPRKKMQPVFCYTGRVRGRWEDHSETIGAAPDFEHETDRFELLDLDDPRQLARQLSQQEFSETSAFQLWTLGMEMHGPAAMAREWKAARWAFARPPALPCQGSARFPRCDHWNSPSPAIADLSRASLARWPRMR